MLYYNFTMLNETLNYIQIIYFKEKISEAIYKIIQYSLKYILKFRKIKFKLSLSYYKN